ncbi:MAG: methyl-accepting chemotaxis protein, partial [Actinobacteria bacterium]
MGIWKKYKSSFLNRLILITVLIQIAYQVVIYSTFYLAFRDELATTSEFFADLAIVIVVGVTLLVLWCVFMFWLGRRFTRPLDEVVQSVRAACQGEIGRKVEVKSEDEIGVLASSYNQMLDLIVYLIRQTQESSRRLQASANEILSATEQQASGSAEQAASISQTTATMEELASTYRQIAENADQVVSMAEASLGSAEAGQQAVMNTLDAMETIK